MRVRLAAKGDQDAINELQTIINNTRLAATQSGASTGTSVPEVHSGLSTQDSGLNTHDYELDFGKPCAILIAILLAFTFAWTCFTLIVGPHAIAHLAPGSSSRGTLAPNQEVIHHEPVSTTTSLTTPPQPINTTPRSSHVTIANNVSTPRAPAPGLKSRGLNEPIIDPFFLAVSSDPHLTG